MCVCLCVGAWRGTIVWMDPDIRRRVYAPQGHVWRWAWYARDHLTLITQGLASIDVARTTALTHWSPLFQSGHDLGFGKHAALWLDLPYPW